MSRCLLLGRCLLVPAVAGGLRKVSGLLALIKSGNILWGMQASPRGFIPDFAGCCASGGGVPPPGQKRRCIVLFVCRFSRSVGRIAGDIYPVSRRGGYNFLRDSANGASYGLLLTCPTNPLRLRPVIPIDLHVIIGQIAAPSGGFLIAHFHIAGEPGLTL